MSKSGAKQSQADVPVYRATEDEQVDLLAQALLREYMHKKKFSSTLTAFDSEHPRDEKTVSSRAVMYDLMMLATTMPVLKERGIETVMEALCYLRVAKREDVEHVKAIRHELHHVLRQEAELQERCAQVEAALATEAGASHKKSKIHKAHASLDAHPTTEEGVAKKKKKKHSDDGTLEDDKKKKKKKTLKDEGDDDGDGKKKKKKKAQRLLSIDELLEKEDAVAQSKTAPTSSQTSSVTTSPNHPESTTANTASATKQDSDAGDSSSAAEDEDGDDYAAAMKAIRNEQQAALAKRTASQTQPGQRKVGWDAAADGDDHDDLHAPARSHSARAAITTTTPSLLDTEESGTVSRPPFRNAKPEQGELGEAAAADLVAVLVGPKRMIPASFQRQGWYPSTTRGSPDYGLEQRQGGPCGVLAVVQARLVQRMLGSRSTTHGRFVDSLVSAMATTLNKIAMGADSGDVKIVLPPEESAWPSSTIPNSIKEQRQWLGLLRSCPVAGGGVAAVEAALRSTGALKLWMQPEGSGLLCFLISCILTRGGNEACRSDMDSPQPLIVEHGYCSQEMTNLLLCGKCVSNTHDGNVDLGGIVLRGYPGPLDVGFLTILESKGLCKVEKMAKYPTQTPAAWVVYNESHYTVLFLKDGASHPAVVKGRFDSGNLPQSIDMFYYDQQGQQDSEVRLTVRRPDEDVAQTTPVPRITSATSYVDIVIRSVPEWSKAAISWNGTDPLL